MAQENDKVTVLFMLGVMTFAIVLIDERWVRAGMGLVPALLLAQRALMGVGVGAEPPPDTGDRRADKGVRGQIQELLKLIREFYAMCHIVADSRLDPDKAKARAQVVEGQLNSLCPLFLIVCCVCYCHNVLHACPCRATTMDSPRVACFGIRARIEELQADSLFSVLCFVLLLGRCFMHGVICFRARLSLFELLCIYPDCG